MTATTLAALAATLPAEPTAEDLFRLIGRLSETDLGPESQAFARNAIIGRLTWEQSTSVVMRLVEVTRERDAALAEVTRLRAVLARVAEVAGGGPS